MKVVLNIEVKELEKKLNRKIVVDEDISLINFCEGILVSFNIDKFLSYGLFDPKYCYSDSVFDYEYFQNDHRNIDNYILKDLIKKRKFFRIIMLSSTMSF